MADVTYLPLPGRKTQTSLPPALRLNEATRSWRKPIGLCGIIGIALMQGNAIGLWVTGFIPWNLTSPLTILLGAGCIVGLPLIGNIVRWSHFK